MNTPPLPKGNPVYAHAYFPHTIDISDARAVFPAIEPVNSARRPCLQIQGRRAPLSGISAPPPPIGAKFLFSSGKIFFNWNFPQYL